MPSKLPAKKATELLNNLLIEARALSAWPFDSPKRLRWRDNARSVLERADVSSSLLDSFDSGQAFSVGSRTTNEQLRERANANLAVMTAALQSAIDQLGWEPECESIPPQPEPTNDTAKTELPSAASSTAQPGPLDSLIIFFVSAALVLFLLWATSRTIGITPFENLPGWLQDAFKAIWTPVAAGAAGLGLAVVRLLSRKQSGVRPNFLLLIAITTVGMLLLIFVLPALFKRPGDLHVDVTPIPIDFVPRFKQGPRPGCACNTSDIAFPNGPYNAIANEEFEVQYDNYPMCAGQGFDRFQGTISWGGVTTTLRNDNGTDFPGIAGSMRVKFSQPGDYNAIASITVDCLDRGCRNTCPSHGAIDVHIR